MVLFQNSQYKTSKPGMTKVLWAPLWYFTSMPTLPDTGAAAGDTVIGVGDFVFDTGLGWIELKNELFKGSQISWKNVGAEEAPSWQTTVNGQIIGLDAQLIEQFKNMRGQPGVALLYDADCGDDKVWVVGCSNAPVFVMFDGRSGFILDNVAKGTNFELRSACMPYVYTGPVDSQPFISISVTITTP